MYSHHIFSFSCNACSSAAITRVKRRDNDFRHLNMI